MTAGMSPAPKPSGVDGESFVKARMIRGGWEETPVGVECDEVFVVFVVCLFDTVTAAGDFGNLAGEGAGEVGGKGSNKLVAIGHCASKLIE